MTINQIDNRDLGRVYTVNDYSPSGFVTGHNPAGEQLLMGVLENELLVAFCFATDGSYLRCAFRPVLEKPVLNRDTAERSQWGAILQDAKRSYMKELDLTPGTIHIRHFAFPEWDIGISEWPLETFDEVQKSLTTTGRLPEDEFIQEWRKNNRWVLHWKKEYWMMEDGEIGDT